MLLRLITAIAISLPLTAAAQDPTESESLYRIARFLLVPDSNSDEVARGLQHLRRSADGGYEPAARDYAQRLESGEGVPKDETAARRYYLVAAEQGDPISQLALASMLIDGRGGEVDDRSAFYLRGQAAAQGDRAAQFQVAYHLLMGIGVTKDPGLGAVWLRLSAEQGHKHAQAMLGLLYRTGQGVPLDRFEAQRWYQQAADQGDEAAARAIREMVTTKN